MKSSHVSPQFTTQHHKQELSKTCNDKSYTSMAQLQPVPIPEARAVESLQNRHQERSTGTVGSATETSIRKRRLHGPSESKEAAAAHRIKMTCDDASHDKILYLNLISTYSGNCRLRCRSPILQTRPRSFLYSTQRFGSRQGSNIKKAGTSYHDPERCQGPSCSKSRHHDLSEVRCPSIGANLVQEISREDGKERRYGGNGRSISGAYLRSLTADHQARQSVDYDDIRMDRDGSELAARLIGRNESKNNRRLSP